MQTDEENTMHSKRRLLLASLMATLPWFNLAHAQDTFKIGFILPMTGPLPQPANKLKPPPACMWRKTAVPSPAKKLN